MKWSAAKRRFGERGWLPSTVFCPPSNIRRTTKHFWFCRMVRRITSSRDFQKRFVETSHQHDRPFDQPRHLLQQPSVLDHLQPLREGEVLRLRLDDRLPPLVVEHDLRRFELRHVIVEAAHADRLAAAHEAVAEGDVARGDAGDLEIDDDRLLRLRPEGAEDGAERAHPAEARCALRVVPGERRIGGRGARAPAHRFRPGESADHRRHRLGDDRPPPRGPASSPARRRNRPSSGRIAIFAWSIEASPAPRRKPSIAFSGAPTRGPFFSSVTSAERAVSPCTVSASRRGVDERLRALIGEPGVDQRIGHQPAQILRRLPLHARRNFLGEQL